MESFICENVFVPLRSGPSHKAEMLSQILFGEKYIIIEKSTKWIKIESLFDNYHGWIDTDHLQHSPVTGNDPGFVINKSLQCNKKDKTRLVLEAGCEIYRPDFENKTFNIGEDIYNTIPEFNDSYVISKDSVPETAMKFINSPYIWGGRIPSGIDCSGLTQLAYKIHGITIPRDSWKQVDVGEDVNFVDETKPGDLVFFDNENNLISHVGMILSRGLIIHASGRVRIDTIDHYGIFKPEIGRYSHRLRMIKRIIL
jgi:gamma-D-glutamyl-L-lysine dipeptidyl-peptidase